MADVVPRAPEKIDLLISELAEKGYFFSEEWIPPSLVENLLVFARHTKSQGRFRTGQIGKGLGQQEQARVRSDQIFWIEDWSLSPFESYGTFLASLLPIFRERLFLPVREFEGHLAVYHPGSFYERHRDRHQYGTARLISTVLYLNTVEDGGELILYPDHRESSPTVLATVRPQAGKVVFFDSRLPHEVRPTSVERWSLTSWFRGV